MVQHVHGRRMLISRAHTYLHLQPTVRHECGRDLLSNKSHKATAIVRCARKPIVLKHFGPKVHQRIEAKRKVANDTLEARVRHHRPHG